MLEYAALTSADPSELARLMTERSAQGWEILQIVSTGSQVTAFVRRAAITGTINTASAASATPTPVAANPTPTTASSPTPVSQPPATAASSNPVTYGSATSTASSVGDAVAPAAWYPDPSGRYELRYWNGSAWTEHVSRNGQQFTDPPVA
jgi:hypothetical protein